MNTLELTTQYILKSIKTNIQKRVDDELLLPLLEEFQSKINEIAKEEMAKQVISVSSLLTPEYIGNEVRFSLWIKDEKEKKDE